LKYFLALLHSNVKASSRSYFSEGNMNDVVWKVLGNVLLAAFLGAVGQLIRVVAGLKKQSDEAVAQRQTLAQRFSWQRLLVSMGLSIAVGAIAGVLAGLQSTSAYDTKTLLAFVGAGYSGTDFLEAFAKKALPG
jgi:hypothetical protein